MCGIAGYINFNHTELLAKQAATIQYHRGPDDQNAKEYKNVLLSHQRLSIIDPTSRSNQPFEKHHLTIIFNGEIYNFQSLKQQLLAEYPDLKFNTTSDTEVLLELYRLKGINCVDELIGMFVFAILDTKTGELFIARDHFGIKPLFYTQINNSFAFSSELKTLINIPGFNKTINQIALTGAMNYLWVPGNQTMFVGCNKVPPASYILIDTNSSNLTLEFIRYWHLPTNTTIHQEDQAIDATRKEIEASVKRHMVADVPVSSFLSGGLDSSLLSVLAAQYNEQLSTYTIASTAKDKKVEQMPEDEKYARQLAKLHHFDHHEIELHADIIKDLPKMVYMLDEPIGDPAALNTFLICKAARANGVKVLLSGMGADEMFFGYRRQKATMMALTFKKIPAVLRRLVNSTIKMLPVKMNGKGIKFTRWAKRFVSFANLPTELAYMQSYSYYNEAELKQLFKQDISVPYNNLKTQHASYFNEAYHKDPVNQMCYTDLHMFMQGLNLTYTDRASMAASVEVRTPFIDKKVVELAMQIDGKLKFKKGQSKYVLKKVAEQYLPHEIIYRPKASFGAPIRSWISGELKEMVNQLLSKENVEKRQLFNYQFVKKLIDDDRNGIKDNAYRIYQLLTVELWFRQFVDQQPA